MRSTTLTERSSIYSIQTIGLWYSPSKVRSLSSTTARGFRHLKPERVEKIKFLGTALLLMTTSVAADETLCLSALIGFDVQDFLDVQNPIPGQLDALVHTRMKKFWSMFDEIPLAMTRFEGPS
jgi:hypothetical protein